MNEDIDLSDTPLEEQVAVLIEDLPLPIRNFLRSSERDATSLRLTKKYGLHADDAGTFERAYIYMLLGVFTPDEFVQELRESGLDEATIRGLATDVNDQVFKKLRAEERGIEPAPATYRSAPPMPQVAPMQVGKVSAPTNLPGQNTTPPQWTTPEPQKSAFIAIPTLAPATTPTPTPGIPPQPASAASSDNSVTPPIYNQQPEPAPEYPHARTMAGDMELASQEQKVAVPTPAPPTIPPPVVPQPEPVREQPAPPPPTWQPPPTAPVRPTPIDRPNASGVPITKEYGNDPYREPIE